MKEKAEKKKARAEKKKAKEEEKKEEEEEEKRSLPLQIKDDLVCHWPGGHWSLKYACMALQHFNKESGAKKDVVYEVVEVVEFAVMFYDITLWYHVNFKAQPENAPEGEAVLFFGEVQLFKGGGAVIACCILKDVDPQGTCGRCNCIHPPDGFLPGTNSFKPDPDEIAGRFKIFIGL